MSSDPRQPLPRRRTWADQVENTSLRLSSQHLSCTLSMEADMYEAIDWFLARSTWHTEHHADLRAFMTAVGLIVRRPGFNADALGEHMRSKVGCENFSVVVDRYVMRARAIRDFLEVDGELDCISPGSSWLEEI